MRKRKILIREWEERRVGGSMKEKEKIMKDLGGEEELVILENEDEGEY